MLHKSHISNIGIYTPEWDAARLGRFTSSKIHNLMAKNSYGEGFMSYVRQKASELITGRNIATEDDVLEDENTVWGLEQEPSALNVFGVMKGLKYLVVQKMIAAPGGRCSSTPDGLWIISSSVMKEDCYNVATVEVKCPRKYPRFLELYDCKTAQDVKKENKAHFWQVVDQMDNCNAALGYYVIYHPLFPPQKNIRIIEFNKINLWDDFILLQERKRMAIEKFSEIVSEFMS